MAWSALPEMRSQARGTPAVDGHCRTVEQLDVPRLTAAIRLQRELLAPDKLPGRGSHQRVLERRERVRLYETFLVGPQ